MEPEVQDEKVFSDAYGLDCIAELALWTSVDDTLAAARHLENRPHPSDELENTLVVPFPDDDRFQAVFTNIFDWLIRSYRVPESKLAMAQLIDSTITSDTAAHLRSLRLTPTVHLGLPGTVGSIFPHLAEFNNKRFFRVVDGSLRLNWRKIPFDV